MTMTANDNPILHFDHQPRFAEIGPEQTAAAVDEVLARLARAADTAAAAQPEWDAMWAPLEEAEESVSRVWSQIEHMHAVCSTPEWRAAHGENLPKVAAQFAKLGQHQQLYDNLRKLEKNGAGLSETRRKIIKDALQHFELSGAGLPQDQKEQFRKNSERLSALAAKFEEHLLDATNDWQMLVAEDDLGEMPNDVKNAARQPDGRFRFRLQAPSYAAFMQYSPARELRAEMYRAYHTRASEAGLAERDNSPVIDEIVALRGEQAQMLGFANYAELAMQTRMAQSPQAVVDFLHDLAKRAKPRALEELRKLREFAADELQIDDLQPWDLSFAADRLRKKQFDFSSAQLRPYLQLDRVLDGLFACVRQLFGVHLKEAEAPGLEGARYFTASAADGAHIGGLYLDLFARDSKRGGAWMAEALSRLRRLGGKLQLPSAHVVCNFMPPKSGSAALLSWEEAQTLFHEFGHALHHVLTEVDEFSASGMSGVEWDAVELPSQFMENFIWDWRVLSAMSAHVETGEQMPRELFDKALAARRFHAGMHLMRQIQFSLFDLTLHCEGGAFMEVLNKVRQDTALLPAPEWDRFPCGFSHIFAGGYAAGYYSYLWAEALSADMFEMFEQSGDILNSELGSRFRQEILAKGGSRPAIASFQATRGRPPAPDPLLRHHGLLAKD